VSLCGAVLLLILDISVCVRMIGDQIRIPICFYCYIRCFMTPCTRLTGWTTNFYKVMPCCAIPGCRSGYVSTIKYNRENGIRNPSFFRPKTQVMSVLFAIVIIIISRFTSYRKNTIYKDFTIEGQPKL